MSSAEGGARPARLLVANRGEIARRVFRTAHAMGIATVAVFSESDRGAPFVGEAGEAVGLGGRSAAESYLDADKVLDAARRAGADAVHPGYGFLSENAAFAQAVIDAGLLWVGPPPSAIAAMGDKLSAKQLMADAGVPTLPSVEIGDGADLGDPGLDFPLLVKASAGGGGKGMRVVAAAAELGAAVEGARREAAAAFGDDTVFLERWLTAPRHVEVQVLGDRHGTIVHCFERECSIQRRHQKIVEEAPSPAVTPALRARLGEAAVTAAAAVGYHSAGTVEFLLDGEGDDAPFYFLEVNTRLQVEHPVTEAITGLDLVREQIRVAAGEPLGYGQDDLAISGHAVEARLYAEDPAAGFLPATGTLSGWVPAGEPAVRFDSGVEAGSVVGVEFDPMLAKVIAHGPTRREAASRLALALERTTVAGVVTNRDFLVATLRSPEFLAGDTTTDFVERVAPPPRFEPDDDALAEAATFVVMARQLANRSSAGALAFLRAGYRNSVMPPEVMRLRFGEREVVVAYRSERDCVFAVTVDDFSAVPVQVVSHDDRLTLDIDGRVRSARLVRVGDGGAWHVHGVRGAVDLVEVPRFPDRAGDLVVGGQVAPMPGRVVRVTVAVGDTVTAGQPLVVMEAMKMEHTITAPGDSVVAEVRCAEGDQVDNGEVLVVLEEAGESDG